MSAVGMGLATYGSSAIHGLDLQGPCIYPGESLKHTREVEVFLERPQGSIREGAQVAYECVLCVGIWGVCFHASVKGDGCAPRWGAAECDCVSVGVSGHTRVGEPVQGLWTCV